MKHIPLILTILFIIGLLALWASIYYYTVSLRQENIALQKSIEEKIDEISESIKEGR